jgi:hypothetical protein
MEGYVNLFDNRPVEGNKPAFRGYFKIDGVEHEFALWAAKEGKKGFSGKYKPKETRQEQTPHNEAKANAYAPQNVDLIDEIPF